MKSNEKGSMDGVQIFLLIFIIVMVLALFSVLTTMKTITVEGQIIDVVAHDDNFQIYMKDGTNYKIMYSQTVNVLSLFSNSTVIIRLEDASIFWIHDDVWTVNSIIIKNSCSG